MIRILNLGGIYGNMGGLFIVLWGDEMEVYRVFVEVIYIDFG